jgi:hypothetical protein
VKTGVDGMLQGEFLLQERSSARGAKRGNRFSSSAEKGSFIRWANQLIEADNIKHPLRLFWGQYYE